MTHLLMILKFKVIWTLIKLFDLAYADGTLYHAVGMLLSRENLPPLLWPFGLRFCMSNKFHQENFEICFVQQHSMIHRLETNKLRNVAKFFAHLLGTFALPWHVLAYIRLTEEDTASSSRIFKLDSFESIFPKDNPKNTRFSINFCTSIGLGGITENLQEYLKNMRRLIMQQHKPVSESDKESRSSDSDDSGSEPDSGSLRSDDESKSGSDSNDRRRRG
ncbi:unnamed protein product [Camellia sinensis]